MRGSVAHGARQTPARPLAVVAFALGLGLAWMAVELALTFATGRVLVPAYALEGFLALLPWQLALFAALGLVVAAVARLGRLGFARAAWLCLGVASFVFLGEGVLEGLLRKRGLLAAGVGALLVAGGLAGVLALLALPARVLSGRWRRAWPLAAGAGWSVFFLLWMQHSVVAIRKWEPGPSVVFDFLRLEHFVAGLATLVVVLLVAALGAGRRRELAVLLAATLAAAPATAPAEAGDRPDVLLILVDTLRFDHLGANVGKTGLTPALDALAAESVLFTRAFSPGNFTKLALPGIHTSLSFNVTQHPLPAEAKTLAEHLKEAGYATYGISTNPYITRAFGYEQGFDVFLDPTSTNEFLIEGLLEALGVAVPGPAYRAGLISSALYYSPVATVRRRAHEFFEASDGPTFVYLHTIDPHGPYLPPHQDLSDDFDFGAFESYFDFDALKGKGVLNSPGYRPALENLKERYRAEVRFTDRELGALFDELRRSGRWDETLVWLMSDHGEAFGEHDWAGHSGKNLSRVLTQVPLLVKPPRSWGIEPRVEDVQVSTYDVLPTTLALLGLPQQARIFGRDLSPLLRGDTPDRERVVVSIGPSRLYSAVLWPWKLDVAFSVDGERLPGKLFDLDRDPDETRDVAAAHPDQVARLEAAVAEWRAQEEELSMSNGAGEVDELTRDQLRKLGYVE